MPSVTLLEQAITETASDTVQAPEVGTGRMLVQLISPGQGSSGYYRPEVLEAAAADRVFPAGTHMYLDHPGPGDRPERSLRDLVAVLDEDASWTGEALVAPARVFEPYRDLVTEMHADIGVSIRATADTSESDVEGKRTRVVERITKGLSVDFVTRAGRGGRILEILEAARQESSLSAVGAEDRSGDLAEGTEPTMPVSEPVLPAPTPPMGENMPEITEAEVQALREASTTAETERDTALRERDEARSELAALRRQEAARPIVAAVLGESTTLRPATVTRIVESLVTVAPATDTGALDDAALRTAAEAARTAAEAELAEYLTESGYGRPRGLGGTDIEESDEFASLFPPTQNQEA